MPDTVRRNTMGNIAEEIGREARVTTILETYYADLDLPARKRMRAHLEAMTEAELSQTEFRLEAAEGSD